MPGLYTVSVLTTLLILIVTAADIAENRLIDRSIKTRAMVACGLIAVFSVAEWVGQTIHGTALEAIWIHRISKVLEFSCAPAIGILVGFAYGRSVKPKLAIALVTAHSIFQWISLFFGWVFWVDSTNVYRRMGFYFVYVVAFLLSIAYAGWCVVRNDKIYRRGMDYVLALIFAILLLGIPIQFLFSHIRVDFLCIAICNLLFYIRYCKIVLQVDAVTGLLNRRCYDVTIAGLDTAAAVLMFDVDKFKQVNDTYGHSVGDLCLRNVGAVLRQVYGKDGNCYRVGGDEFCVILYRNWDHVKDRNQQFLDAIGALQKEDPRIPRVSVGYSIFYPIDRHIRNTIDTADAMLYRNKHGLP